MKAAITFDSLNKKDQMRVIEAAKKVYLETQEVQIKWMWAITLWTLHESEGYGAQRLSRFLDRIEEAFDRDAERFELNSCDAKKGETTMSYGDLCQMRLERLGINVDEIYKRFEGDE